MTNPTSHDRFEELEAGRLLGDLTSEERNEWRELSREHAEHSDSSLELAAAAVEAEFALGGETSLPSGLAGALRDGAREFSTRPQEPGNVVEGGFRRRILAAPGAGWAFAAGIAILFVVVIFVNPAPDVLEVVDVPIEERTADLVTPAFEGQGTYAGMTGKVVWSDDLQEGYMELANLKVNDPSINQYQLWIVDPARSAEPVDGGVFDVDSAGTVRVPIDAKLSVRKPQAFVITLEKPGGVVVSSQKVVVAVSEV